MWDEVGIFGTQPPRKSNKIIAWAGGILFIFFCVALPIAQDYDMNKENESPKEMIIQILEERNDEI